MLIQEMVKVEHCGKRVVTTAQLAEVYGVSPYRIKDNFRNNKEHFTEGTHYFKLTGAAMREFKRTEGINLRLGLTASNLVLWTYQGCARHCKMLNTPKAWEVFDQLEKFYFECKGTVLPAPAEEIDVLKKEMELLKAQLPAAIEKLEFAVVYMLLMSNGAVKIGMTANLSERTRQLKLETGLDILAFASTPFMAREEAALFEQSLHKKFSAQNIGGEFYKIKFVDAVKYLAAC